MLINDYYYFEKDIFSKIEDTIGKTVNITVMKELNRNYDIFKFDFIINTIQSNLDIKIPIINTSPFLNQKDIKKIESFIDVERQFIPDTQSQIIPAEKRWYHLI